MQIGECDRVILEVNEAQLPINNNKSDTKYTSILEEFLREHLDDLSMYR